MHKLMMIGCAVAIAAGAILPARSAVICSGDSAAIRVNMPVPTTVNKSLKKIYASPWAGAGESVSVSVDGTCLFSTTNQTETQWTWQPLTLGNHTLKCTFGTNVLTKVLNVTALDFFVTPAPNPPMAKDNNISITPTTRNFGVEGGGNAILVSGSSATWTAAVSDPWITLNATSGSVGYPVAYTVSANTNVEQRTGYVYVSGWTHTVTQDGVGGTISPESREFEHQGGSGTITVSAANKMVWQARPNVNWINVLPTSGMGTGSVSYNVAKYDEVATRQGTLTVAGNTFTVFQYGRRIKLSTYNVTQDYETHVIPITVNALAITQWSVTPQASWISVVDAGNGQGGDLVTIAIAENPSYKARTGTVKIGTETFTVTQQGRPTAALSFSVNPTASTASVEGANGTIAVTATPDLPWTATSGANWLTIYVATATGAGNGNVVYSVSPNPTLAQRTGTVTVTPEAASGMTAKTHKVTQPAATAALSSNGYQFEASGESYAVTVSCADIVQWTIVESLDWITVNGSTSRTGPGTVTLQAAANNTVYPRSGTVKIAGKTFSVSQKARGVELEYDTKLFGTDGGYESISIHPDGNVSWTAVASDATWITIFQGDSGTGDGEILYIVSPYVGNGTARTGWITVGDKKVYITQRAYDLSIQPNGAQVAGNNGAGEFGVSASIGDVWNAIVTEPWITLVSGYNSGTGSGTVRFIYTENTTGKTRTGKIIVSGEVYTLEQRARQMVTITATAEHGGHVSGGGTYDLGTQVTLTAVPDSGYKFSHWTGSATSMQNPLTFTVDTAKSYNAVFEPLPIAFTSVVSSEDGVSLAWNNLAWAGTYRIYRGSTSVPSSATVLVELQNSGNCTYLDATGDVDVTYWYWIEAEGPSDEVMSDPMTGKKENPIVFSPITYENLKGATNPNPSTYEEGKTLVFSAPGGITGYTFAGWTPTQITASMTGAQTVRANWTAKSYIITFNANGGSGDTSVTKTYGSTLGALPTPTRTGHTFDGWFTLASGGTQISASTTVTGGVTYYAHWTANSYTVKFNANGGSGTTAQLTCTYGQNATLTANAFTRTGHAFAGWMTSANGTTVAYTDGQSVLNLTNQMNATVNLYAKWTDKWYVDDTGDNANQGDNASQPFKTIQHAINKSVPGMMIIVADGTYAPINSNNKAITIQSVNGAEKTIIDGGYPAATNRCVHAGGLANMTNTVIRGFTIQNGSTFGLTSGNNGAGVAGGTLYDCVVRSNHGSGLGGGIIYSTMYNCTISNNDTQNKGGGTHSARLMNCLIANNSCVNHGAGACGGVLIDCMVISNRADRLGGGVCEATLTNCVIRDNVALTYGGGAYGGSMYNCIVTNNIAYQDGGGMYGATATKCVIVANQAYQSGGGAGNTTCHDCELLANKATKHGGGTHNCKVYNSVLTDNESGVNGGGASYGELQNCLVYDNYASKGNGGGVDNVVARNCTLYGNTCSGVGGGINTGLSNNIPLATNFNCIVYGNAAAQDNDIEQCVPSFNCYTNDPQFIRAEAGDFRLRYNSPCINAGSNEYVTNTVDFAGNARIDDNTVDIGAYEYSASSDTNFTVQVENGTGGTIYYEGDTVPIVANAAPAGYSFKEWTGTAADVALVASETAASTTFKMPGRAVMLTATYKANSYIIAYNANGGSGTMDATPATYDSEATVAQNGFTREGYLFTGWATNKTDEVVYTAGQSVTNLTAQSEGVVMLYAVWESEAVEPPVIVPADGATFKTETCTVAITCATPGAVIYYSSNGRTPTMNARYLYSGPFTISDTATITAFAVKGDVQSDYVDATITHIMPEQLTLKGVLDEEKLGTVTTGDEVEWMPIEDAAAKVGGSCAVSGTITDDDYVEHTTWLKTKVSGKGTLSFWWRVDCEPDPRGRFTYDYGKITIDGAMVDRKDGTTEWMNYSMTFDEEGEHEIVWTYVSDGYLAEDGDYAGRMWVDGVSWSGEAVAVDPIPAIEGDADVAEALSGSADGHLVENIKSAVEYNDFRTWVDARGLDHRTVKESPRAWLSYALDAEGLIERDFVKGDLLIDSFKSADGGSYALEVVVAGFKIGANAKAENLVKIFIVEGSASLAGTFSPDSVTSSLGMTADGKLSVVATPKSASGSFFIRVCMQLTGEEDSGGELVMTSSTVMFDVNGGTLEVESSTRLVENGAAVGTLPSPIREGYVFDGWWTAASGGTQVTAETTVTADVTYYAHWTEETSNIGLDTSGLYCIVDLSDGANASTYPVSYLDTEPNGGFNADEYKTTKLVLRRIDPGTFLMGGQYNVTLSKSYYIGVFEVTQKQYELVMGTNPSDMKGDKLPVEKISYNMIRGSSEGANWPSSTVVDPTSFMGIIRSRTGLGFDLPTEAQWEYACRAGTTSDYNNGGSTVDDLSQVGKWNSSGISFGTHDEVEVGSYLPNAWGLYDMHGNIGEWCLDWYAGLDWYAEMEEVVDPCGPMYGSSRVWKGGSFYRPASECTSNWRNEKAPNNRTGFNTYGDNGFRLSIPGPTGICTVTFNANGGDGDTIIQTAYGSVLGTLPIPKRTGYIFSGWFTTVSNGTQVPPSMIVTADVTYYAHWREVVSLASGQTYCVIDLSSGVDTLSYPISYLDDVPSGGWTDEYKTTNLVLRRIEPGSFLMGGQYDVTMTKPYYIGVFEVTQKQYELVTGASPSYYKGDARPVENVSWNIIRGESSTYDWPTSTEVDLNSFIGKIRARTGLDCDLPTEAQWEYACRAGTTSAYNNGSNLEEGLRQLGRYGGNRSDGKGGYSDAHTTVGSYQPNVWGLYDMHGNVQEWCLNWRGPLEGGTDPQGPTTWTDSQDRILRGGCHYHNASTCDSSSRVPYYPHRTFHSRGDFGFRLATRLGE